MTISELRVLHNDCLKAVHECPQGTEGYYPKEIDIIDGKCSYDELLSFWSNKKTLWEFGYHKYLSQRTKEIIKEYKIKQIEQSNLYKS